MSLIVWSALLTLSPTDTVDPGPFPNWSSAASLPAASSKPRNQVHLDGSRLLWNGEETSESHVQSFLAIVKQLNPQPLTILSYGAGVPRRRVQQVRAMIDGALRCEPATCLEVTQARK